MKQRLRSQRGENESILVVEDIAPGGGYVAFCGAVIPQDTTDDKADHHHSPPDAYVYAQLGRNDICPAVADLLVSALHGWLSGPRAVGVAASEARKRRDVDESFVVQGGGAGIMQREQEEEGAGGGGGEQEEMVDWVDTEGRVICPLPRAVVHANNILHRGAGVMVRNKKVHNFIFF